jgi:hypothetical protein
MRPKLDNYIYTRAEFEHYSAELFEFMIEEKIEPQKHETYPLKGVARAHTVRISCLEAYNFDDFRTSKVAKRLGSC